MTTQNAHKNRLTVCIRSATAIDYFSFYIFSVLYRIHTLLFNTADFMFFLLFFLLFCAIFYKCLPVLFKCDYKTLTFSVYVKYNIFVVGMFLIRADNMKAYFRCTGGEMPSPLLIWFFLYCPPLCFYLHFSCPSSFPSCPLLAMVGWLSLFQATAPVSIPVGPELAGLGNGNGTGPGIGTGNGISVSWQSPPVIFKGVPVSEALSHAFLSSS